MSTKSCKLVVSSSLTSELRNLMSSADLAEVLATMALKQVAIVTSNSSSDNLVAEVVREVQPSISITNDSKLDKSMQSYCLALLDCRAGSELENSHRIAQEYVGSGRYTKVFKVLDSGFSCETYSDGFCIRMSASFLGYKC